jgi:DNA polymerase
VEQGQGEQRSLFGELDDAKNTGGSCVPQPQRVPKHFVTLAEVVACHRDPQRWSTLYCVLWRVTHGEPSLLDVAVDDDVHRLLMMEKQVRFDGHKMKAFVRFRRVVAEDGTEQFIAWHRSEHRVLRHNATFFRNRFAVMRWSILTPFESAHWDGEKIEFGPGAPWREAPSGDELEELWRTYYANIFNPARIKLKAMAKEMPRRYWATMPETELIPALLKDAPRRVEKMVKHATPKLQGAAAYFPKIISLPTLRDAAKTCRGCEIYCNATQTVFGEGPENALAAFVAEQPGDNEDRAGRPFVGPAGQLFDQVLSQVGIERSELYITGAVKHFKFEPRGTRRIHSKPNAREIAACRPWVEAELELVKPHILVLMGNTAGQSLIGPEFRITRKRGKPFESRWAPWTLATFHPSALLRAPEEKLRAEMREKFVADLALVARRLAEEKSSVRAA